MPTADICDVCGGRLAWNLRAKTYTCAWCDDEETNIYGRRYVTRWTDGG